MKRKLQTLLLVFTFAFAMKTYAQVTGDFRSSGSGNWSNTGTWQRYSSTGVWQGAGVGENNPAQVPGVGVASGNVTIQNGHTVTFDITNAVAIASLTVGGGASGILQYETVTNRTLTITGNLSISSGAQFNVQNAGSQAGSLIVGGNFSNSGTLNLRQSATRYADITVNGTTISGNGAYTFRNLIIGGIITNSSTSTFNINGDLTINNTLTCSAGTISFMGAGAQNINGTANPTFNNFDIRNNNTAVTVAGTIASININGTFSIQNNTTTFNLGTTLTSLTVTGTFTMANSSTFDFGTTVAKTATLNGNLVTPVTITMTGAGLAHQLKLGGTAIGAPSTFNTTAGSGSTVEYTSAGAQTIFASANYRNLKISGSGTKTFAGATTVNNNFDITGAGVTVSIASTLTLSGNLTASGTGTTTWGGNSNTANVTGNLLVTNNTTFTIGSAAGQVKTINVTGNVQVDAGSTCNNGTFAATNLLSISGNLTVDGNFNMVNSFPNNVCNVTFSGATSNTVTGSGATCNFNQVTINKGVAIANVLDVQRVITMSSPTAAGTYLTLTNGTFKLSSASTLTPYYGAATICAGTAKLWLNNSGASVSCVGTAVNANPGAPTVTGTLQITAGTFGYGSGNDVMSFNSATSILTIDGGTLNMYGAVAFTSTSQFNMTAGNFNIDAQAFDNLAGATTILSFGSTSAVNAVTFTGGTLTITDPHSASAAGVALFLTPNPGYAYNFSGSTINFGDGLSNTSGVITDGFEIDGGSRYAFGSIALNNGTSSGSNRYVRLLNTDCIVNDNLSFGTNVNDDLRLNGRRITLNGTVTPGSGIITGSATSTIAIGGNNTAAMTLPPISGGNLLSLTLNKTGTNNVVNLGSSVTLAAAGVLTLTSGVLELGNYNLTLSNSTAGAIAGAANNSGNMISTNGTGYLVLNANKTLPFVYPIGSGSPTRYYSPLTITAIGASTLGTVSARAVPTALGTTFINKYWDVLSSVARTTVTATFQYDPAEANASATTVAYSPGNPSTGGSMQTPPTTGSTTIGANSFTVTGTAPFNGWWSEGTQATYYSYQTGSWNTASTWTTDPSGTLQIGSSIPAFNDKVVILSGRTVTLPANITTQNLDITIQAGGFIDMDIYSFSNGVNVLAGQGTLQLSSANFPTVTTNTFVNSGGGTTEYRNTADFSLPVAQTTYNNLSINAPGVIATQLNNLTLNGNLYVNQGTFQINDNSANRRQLTINGNVLVDAGASITVGTGVTNTTTNPALPIVTTVAGPFIDYYDSQSHRVVVYGDFTNNGTVRFTNLTNPVYNAFPPTVVGATTGFATVYFRGSTNNSLTCNNTTDFYNLVLDKGTDQTYTLSLYSGAYNYFRLFGANNAVSDVLLGATAANPNLKKALWIRTGTLSLSGLTAIPSLTEGTAASSEYYIPSNGALIADGSEVVVLATADDYNEVNVSYSVAGGSGLVNGISQNGFNALVVYGKLQVNDGYLSTRESAGIVTNNTASGQIVINGGVVDAKQLSAITGSASYLQTGGVFFLRGRFQRLPAAYTLIDDITDTSITTVNTARAINGIVTTLGTFNLENTTNIFSMTGGTIRIYDVTDNITQEAFDVKSSSANINVTDGTVEFVPITGTVLADASSFYVNTTASLGNVLVNRASSSSVVQLATNPLIVLNSFNVNAGDFNASSLNLTVGGDFSLASGTTYTTGTNTTTLNGTGTQTFTVNLAAPLSLNKFTISKSSGVAVNFAGTQLTVNVLDNLNITLGTLNDNGTTINVAKNVYNSGLHTGTGKISLNGAALTQTIDGNGTFENLELNNTNAAAAPVSLIANTTINGVLTFSQNKLFNISTYNLTLNANASIANAGALRYIQSAGNAGDGGLTKVYSSTTAFNFPVGAASTSHVGVPNYTPGSIGFGVAPTTYGSITVVPVGYAHPNETTAGRSLSYFWRVRSSGFTMGPATVTHGYTYSINDVIVGAGITESEYVAARYDQTTASWTKGTTSDLDIVGKIIGQPTSGTFLQNVSFIDGDYTAGDDNPTDPFGIPLKFYSIATGRWTTNTTWSYTSGGVAVPAGAVAGVNYPGANSIVYIEGNKTVTLNSATGTPSFGTAVANLDVQNCASLTIRSGSTLDIGYNPGCNFALLVSDPAGNGTFRLATSFTSGSTFANPSGDFSDFNVNLGTTELYSTNATAGTTYWLKNGVTTYGNLIISPLGGSNIIFPNNDLTIYGDCTTNGQNADSWFCPTWTAAYPTAPTVPVAKTITILGNLNISGGAFYWMPPLGGVAQNVVVSGDVTVGTLAGMDVWGAAFPRTLTIGGSFINNANGNINAPASTRAQCNFATVPVTFNGSTSASITNTIGSPRTIFGTVTVNKGTSQSTTLTCDIGGTLTTPTDNWLTLQNGTFRYMRTNPAAGAHFTISTSTNFTIPATAGLYVNMPSNTNNVNVLIANNNADASDLLLNGKLTVISGNVYVGPTAAPAFNNDIEYSGGGSSAIEVQGGNLYVNGQIRRPTTSTNGILNYTQSGGAVTINGNTSAGGSAVAVTRAKLEVLNTGSQFNMSGTGTLTIARGSGTTFGDLFIRPQTSTITGGTIILTNVVPNTVQNYTIDANTPLYNLTVTGAAAVNANVGILLNPLVLNGSLTLTNARSILNSNNINVTINGDLNNSGTYNYGTNLTTFSGGTQNITGTTISNFYNLTVAPVSSLTVNNNFTVNSNLIISSGTLALGTKLLTLKGNLTNNSNYSDNNSTGGISLAGTALQQVYGTGVYNRLELNNSSGAKLNNDITLQGDFVLTQGVFDINQYLLMLTQTSNIGGSGFGTTKMIKSDGVASNAGTRKFFNVIAAATPFTFPVGVAGKYTPAIYNITNSATVGYIAVNPVNSYQPTVLDPNNVLQYYWAIESSGISNFTGSLTLQHLAGDVLGTESNYVAASLDVLTGDWTKAPVGAATDNVNETLHTISFSHAASNNLTGDYTAGDSAAIPSDVPTFQTISNGNWTDSSIWVPVSPTVISCPAGGPMGYNVIINDTVTTDVNNCSAYNTTINYGGVLKIVSPTYGHNLGTVNGTGILYLENGNLPAGNFSMFFDCKFGGGLEYGGTGTYSIIATLFSSIPKILISGTGTRVLPNKDLTICTQLKIDGAVTLDNSVNNKKLIIQGTMETYNGGVFKSGTGAAPASTVTFAGSAAQSLGGPLGDFTGSSGFNNLEIDNTNGLSIGNNGNIEVKNNLLLTNGLINTSTTNKLTIVNTLSTAAVPTGGSSTSYVDGPLIKQIPNGSSFLFPIGKGTVKSHSYTVTSGSTQYYTVEYFPSNATYASMVSPILAVNSTESWSLSNGSATGKNAKVKIAWDSQSDLTAAMTAAGASGSLADMRVSEYNGSAWTAVGTAATLVTSGTVTAGDVSSNTYVSISTTPKLYTTGSISNTVSKATFSPSGVVCGSAGIPVTFTALTPITLNYTLYYTINSVAQTPEIVTSLPYTLPTPVAGAYQLTGFTYNGSTVTGRVDPTVVDVYATPNATTAGSDQTLCGLSGTILVGNDPAPYSGTWSIISGLGGIVVSPTVYNSVFTGISNRTYSLVWTNDNNGCQAKDTVVIAFPLLPTTPAAFTKAPSPVCQGSTGKVYTVPNVAGNTYDWTYTGTGATITGGTTNSVTIDFSGTATSGNLKVRTTNSCGTSAYRSKAIVVSPLPVATFSYTGSPYCKTGANPVPTFSGGGVAGKFSSTSGLSFVSTSTGEINIASSTAGTYTVTNKITTTGGCGTITATSTIVIAKLGTWLGSISTDWFDPNNWGCSTVPTKLIDITIPSGTTYMPTIAGISAECKDITINSGATLTLATTDNLDVWGDWTNKGTFTANSGTVTFMATTTIGGSAVTTFNNFVIAATGVVTAPASNFRFTGDWTNDGTFNCSTGTVTLLNTAAQNIGGLNSTVFYNLTMNKSGAGNKATLTNNQRVNNTLTMTNGNIVLGSYVLTLGNSATTSGGSASSYIEADGTGTVNKMYNATGGAIISLPVGDLDDYSPFSLKINPGTTLAAGAYVSLNLVDAVHPNLGTPSDYITRYWLLTESGITTPDYDATYTYTNADIVGFETNLIACKYSTATTPNWNFSTSYGVGTINTATNTLSWTGVTSFGEHTGEADPGPLPIQLVSFDATLENNQVNLNWTTASEVNNDYFTIEKTKDFVNYEFVTTVKGAGNSTKPIKYSSIDENPYHGISYYRLKQTDYNGRYSYSKNVAIDHAIPINLNFDVFPNPSDGVSINLFINADKNEKVLISVCDASGKESYSKIIVIGENGMNGYAIDPPQKLPAGTYTIKATTAGKNVFSKKLVVKQ